jgi:hypothetical protein
MTIICLNQRTQTDERRRAPAARELIETFSAQLSHLLMINLHIFQETVHCDQVLHRNQLLHIVISQDATHLSDCYSEHTIAVCNTDVM